MPKHQRRAAASAGELSHRIEGDAKGREVIVVGMLPRVVGGDGLLLSEDVNEHRYRRLEHLHALAFRLLGSALQPLTLALPLELSLLLKCAHRRAKLEAVGEEEGPME